MKRNVFWLLISAPISIAYASIGTHTTQLGEVYIDEAGKTLYTFAKDPVGQSVCQGKCEDLWPPFIAEKSESQQPDSQSNFSQITRPDGRIQWALNGKPLYRWAHDKTVGDIFGAGVKGVWPLARADDVTIRLFNDGKRKFLVDKSNLTLYTFHNDKKGQSACYGACEQKWPPAYVDEQLLKKGRDRLKLTGGFGITPRKDNTYQWTYQGYPLYRWVKDTQPGDTKGDGIKGVWHLTTQ